jgi:2-polyprenyl-3-methyl-5-hydroxy-6-metoxy-1,4-benzoquinol methylase
MEGLLPDRLKELWRQVEANERPGDDYEPLRNQWLAEYRAIWNHALVSDGRTDLKESLLAELGRYVGVSDLIEMERRCRTASAELANEWDSWVDERDRSSVEYFYNHSRVEMYNLMWWHTLLEDDSPLSYVLALQFGQTRGCGTYLDFGSGVGSGALVFKRNGFEVTCADISSPMLDLCRFRLESRGWPGQCVDLKTHGLPDERYDFITAMDVFEHLYDPVEAAERLWKALKPGGFILGRWAVEEGDERRGHIVTDLRPTLARMRELGLVEVWRDDWIWGHQAFQKPAGHKRA